MPARLCAGVLASLPLSPHCTISDSLYMEVHVLAAVTPSFIAERGYPLPNGQQRFDCVAALKRIPEHVPADSNNTSMTSKKFLNFFRNFVPKNPEKILIQLGQINSHSPKTDESTNPARKKEKNNRVNGCHAS